MKLSCRHHMLQLTSNRQFLSFYTRDISPTTSSILESSNGCRRGLFDVLDLHLLSGGRIVSLSYLCDSYQCNLLNLQSVHEARQFLKFWDPELGKPLPEKCDFKDYMMFSLISQTYRIVLFSVFDRSYAENCEFTYDNVMVRLLPSNGNARFLVCSDLCPITGHGQGRVRPCSFYWVVGQSPCFP